MLLPFWLALSASVAVHIGVLLAPGWELPLDDEPDTVQIDATIAPAQPALAQAPEPARPPPVRKRRPAKPPPTPAAPVADVPGEGVPASEPPPPVAEAPPPEPEVATEAPPLAVLPAPTFANRWPRSGRIVYQVTRGEQGLVVGQSEQRWEHDSQRYHLHAETETTGLAALFRPAKVVQDSRGTFDAAGLRPLEFEVLREGKGKDSVRFEPEQGQIVSARGGSAPFVPAAQDLLSLFYQLAALSFDVPEYPLTVATGHKVATYAIAVSDETTLDTPQGPRLVRHLKVAGNAREDATEIWLDVESRLPLKIRHRDRKGEIYDQIAITIETETAE
ncbi:MAG: DUF3108 domain-containing protein [Pseudomonadota bacterium]